MSKNRALLVGIVVSVSTLMVGCAKQQAGGFTEIDHDKVAHTYQFRYQPQQLDHAALQAYIAQRCAQQGFDKSGSFYQRKLAHCLVTRHVGSNVTIRSKIKYSCQRFAG